VVETKSKFIYRYIYVRKTPSIEIYHPAIPVSSVVRHPFPVSNVHIVLLDLVSWPRLITRVNPISCRASDTKLEISCWIWSSGQKYEESLSLYSISISLSLSLSLSFNQIGKGMGVFVNFNLQKRNVTRRNCINMYNRSCRILSVCTSIYPSTSMSDKTPETTLIYVVLSAINNLRLLQ